MNKDSIESLDLLLRIDALNIIINNIGVWLEAEYFNASEV